MPQELIDDGPHRAVPASRLRRPRLTRAAMDQLVVDNILAWAAGKPPLTPVAGNALAAKTLVGRSVECWRVNMTRLVVGLAAVCIAGAALGAGRPLGESAQRDDRQLGILQRRSRQDLHARPSKAILARPASRSNSTPIAATCSRLVRDIAGWKLPENDLLYLLDAKGKSVLEFSEVGRRHLRSADAGRWRAVPAKCGRCRRAIEAGGTGRRRLDDRAQVWAAGLHADAGDDKGRR